MTGGVATIDLRSDTASLPTSRMREAMASAPLGDETLGEDPTVERLEATVCERLGFEAALLTISATMSNLVAVMTHCTPGGEVFLDRDVHLLRAEAGGLAGVAGVMPTVVVSRRGHILRDALADAIHDPTVVSPRPQLVWLENTHNRAGGTVMPIADQSAVADLAHDRGLRVHLDGARVINAAAAQGISLAEACRGADSVTFDLTKALSCPLGAVLLGDRAFIDAARLRRRMLGGGMRQAGIIAASGLVAFEDLLDRVGDDHRRAGRIAAAIGSVDGYRLDPPEVETNMIYLDVAALGGSAVVARELAADGVLVLQRPPGKIRLVTYHSISDEHVDVAVTRMASVAGRLLEPQTARVAASTE
jgi:threonine aldolase